MNVAELIRELSKLPQENEVVLSEDSEGNRFHQVAEVDVMAWDGDSVYCLDYCCGDAPEDATPVVVIWP